MIRLPKCFAGLFALALVIGLAAPALAAEAQGKIKSVSADTQQFVLTDKTGKDWTIQVAPTAKISLGGKSAKLKDLKAGDTVIVTYAKVGDKLTATSIVGK